MTTQEIARLIESRNEDATREMRDEAVQLIDRIAELQQAKIKIDAEIAEHRESLKKLSITPLTPAELLGESL